jgi:serine/threonine protein kinase
MNLLRGKLKKWVLIVVFSAISAVGLSFFNVKVTAESQVIYIKGGEPILADHVGHTEQFVIYEADGKNGMFMRDDVTSVGSIQIQKRTSIVSIMNRHTRQLMTGIGISGYKARYVDSRILIFFGVLVAISLIARLIPLITKKLSRSATNAHTAIQSRNRIESSDQHNENSLTASDERDIALFFLELYKLQNGLEKDAPSRFKMIASSPPQKMKFFNLEVKRNDDWMSRRMSVGPLGEETGSKSRCYYVIYDTHMVIKIPPTPVTDMQTYARAIRSGVQIAAQLAPVACIVPLVSVVLHKIKKLPYSAGLTQEQLEKCYIRLAEDEPAYQEYLKIGGCFAYFMELTNNFFLGRVINELNSPKNRTGEEIREIPEVAWDQAAFTTRYGLASLPIFEGLQSLYRLCETEVRRILQKSGHHEAVHPFQIKNWFLSCICGETIGPENTGINETLRNQIEAGFADVFKANRNPVDDLNRLMERQLEATAFSKNRHPIENIASCMLQLLSRLDQKRIALRDLKPDNLFFDANPNNYPVFLNNRSDFSIGVIDVETAVSLNAIENNGIAQPLLGGTPLYATPSNLLTNKTIENCLGDVADTLHYQDWFAVIAIIFKEITGKNLFLRAARSFPELLKVMKSDRSKSHPEEEIVKTISRKFWSAAAKDFRLSMAAHANLLKLVILSLPASMVQTIQKELAREKSCIERAIRKHVSFSPLFKSDKNRTFLLNASSETITRQVNRWGQADCLEDHHRNIAPEMVAFLNNLNRLKRGASEKQDAHTSLALSPYAISAYTLLEAMFQVVFRAMYKARWNRKAKADDASDRQAATRENHAMVTTILYEG